MSDTTHHIRGRSLYHQESGLAEACRAWHRAARRGVSVQLSRLGALSPAEVDGDLFDELEPLATRHRYICQWDLF